MQKAYIEDSSDIVSMADEAIEAEVGSFEVEEVEEPAEVQETLLGAE